MSLPRCSCNQNKDNGWISFSLRDLAEYINGRVTRSSELRSDGVPVIKIAELNHGITETTDRVPAEVVQDVHRVTQGDVLFSWSGSVGIYRYSGPLGALNQHIFRVVAKPGVDQVFLYYLLLSQIDTFRSYVEAKRTTMGHVTLRDLERIHVEVPPLPEQRAIAHILGTLDDKIELNRRMSETLEAMARAIFKAWFVDFEPVRAKMEGRWRRGESLPGFPAHLYDLFPDRLVDSELGEIPEGWRVGTLGDIAENPRRSVQPHEIDPTTPYIALEHMPRGRFALWEWSTADELESNKFEFKRGEILFGKLRPYFHKVGVAPVDGVCSTDIVVVKPKKGAWFGFVLGHISSTAFVDYTSAGSTGTRMPRTSWNDMARYQVALPPEKTAESFTAAIRAPIDRMIGAIHESRTLAALRDALLPKLIRGEIRVHDAERFLAERGL
ncbi:restriction endonuclease subunit S [Thermomicrobiaceae bacterium CFH 74404]|uniref:Restriction endonuclease subunit S n=1 Tax=Thermalbibacter longus TaxID=2951981 RepID=A0AA42BAW1_9BACT|nr:restriction endonuclease subunit S [Thermalbibacter longus]MCM8750197.1 restriction endonuclease subunit S [Thermalbibacter longus]